MGQNDKGLGAGLDSGAQLLSLIPVEISNPLTNADSRSAMPSQQSPEANASNLDRNAAEVGEVSPLDKIARDMTLLAELVTRRRQAKPESSSDPDQELPSEAPDCSETLGFEPLGIAFCDEAEVQTVDSVAQAIECLTTKWPMRHGDAFEEALQACVDGIKGRVSPEHVRSALVKVAEAAGMRIDP
jgi:hypothetical protein